MQASFVDNGARPLINAKRMLVIVGGGDVDLELLKALQNDGALVVAADGGAGACARAGIVPEAIIGDLDSLARRLEWAKKTRVIAIKEQETTDFEKCLYSTSAPLTIGLGLSGKRLDHTLDALDVMWRYAAKRHIVLVDTTDLALVRSGSFSLVLDPGARVSIHPLEKVVFARSTGLRYPLDGLELAPGQRVGTSNRATSGFFSIEPAPGQQESWLLLLDKHCLGPLITELENQRPGPTGLKPWRR